MSEALVVGSPPKKIYFSRSNSQNQYKTLCMQPGYTGNYKIAPKIDPRKRFGCAIYRNSLRSKMPKIASLFLSFQISIYSTEPTSDDLLSMVKISMVCLLQDVTNLSLATNDSQWLKFVTNYIQFWLQIIANKLTNHIQWYIYNIPQTSHQL